MAVVAGSKLDAVADGVTVVEDLSLVFFELILAYDRDFQLHRSTHHALEEGGRRAE